jgi:hypothetical protein
MANAEQKMHADIIPAAAFLVSLAYMCRAGLQAAVSKCCMM